MQRIYTYRSGYVLASHQAIKEFFTATSTLLPDDRKAAILELVENDCAFLYKEWNLGKDGVIVRLPWSVCFFLTTLHSPQRRSKPLQGPFVLRVLSYHLACVRRTDPVSYTRYPLGALALAPVAVSPGPGLFSTYTDVG